MALPARSHNEAMVYVVLRECQACGEQIRDITDELQLRAGAFHTEYRTVCQRCGHTDSYLFQLPERDPQWGVEGVVYGGAEPSRIIDAGEWLRFADLVATGGPVEPAGLTSRERADAAQAMMGAAAAVAEVLKFIPPHEDRVPLTAIWSDRGKDEFARDPWRMRRGRLEVLAAAYRDSAARLLGDGHAAAERFVTDFTEDDDGAAG